MNPSCHTTKSGPSRNCTFIFSNWKKWCHSASFSNDSITVASSTFFVEHSEHFHFLTRGPALIFNPCSTQTRWCNFFWRYIVSLWWAAFCAFFCWRGKENWLIQSSPLVTCVRLKGNTPIALDAGFGCLFISLLFYSKDLISWGS